jgi:hypothetical protein
MLNNTEVVISSNFSMLRIHIKPTNRGEKVLQRSTTLEKLTKKID